MQMSSGNRENGYYLGKREGCPLCIQWVAYMDATCKRATVEKMGLRTAISCIPRRNGLETFFRLILFSKKDSTPVFH